VKADSMMKSRKVSLTRNSTLNYIQCHQEERLLFEKDVNRILTRAHSVPATGVGGEKKKRNERRRWEWREDEYFFLLYSDPQLKHPIDANPTTVIKMNNKGGVESRLESINWFL
jgi:hypothetical protein